MRRRVLRVEPECGESRHQYLPDRGAERSGGNAGFLDHGIAVGRVWAEAVGDWDAVVQWGVLFMWEFDEGGGDVEDCEDGVWDVGDIWNGGDLQFVVYLYGRAVSNGGEERGVGVWDAGVADGGDIGAVCGGDGGRAAVCCVCRVWHYGWGSGVLLARDAE